MRRAFQATFAVVFGVLFITATAFGGVMLTNPDVNNFEEAADELIGTGEGQVALAGALLVTAGVATYAYYTDDNNADDLADVDANETHAAIYDSASIQAQNNDIIQTGYSNYLDDTQTIALMEGKQAYIRALNDGANKSVATAAAEQAVGNYYAVKQKNLIASWNTSVIVANSTYQNVKNTSSLEPSEVWGNVSTASDAPYWTAVHDGLNGPTWSESVTLANGNVTDSLKVTMMAYDTAASDVDYQRFNQGITDGRLTGSGSPPYGLSIRPAGNQSSKQVLMRFTDYGSKWSDIENQTAEVNAQLGTFINNTYDTYQQGDINNTDLVDPYLGARDYAPENGSQYQSWALQTLSALGLNSPQNISNVGRMNVSVGPNATYTGILMSDGTPSGGFTVGETYNASKIDGLQFVALDGGGQHELTDEFTLDSAETADGQTIETNETITYKNITYETTNTTEFKQLQEELDQLQAELNARQQTLRNSGGGGGWLPDFGSLDLGTIAPVGLLAAGAAVFILAGRN